MLTLEQLQRSNINSGVAQEAHAQAQKRLEDALATKAGHEQKAFALMAGYLTGALALFAAFGAMAKNMPDFAPAMFWAGACLLIGAGLCVAALWPRDYGSLGSDPRAWLRPGVIDGGEKALPFALAYEVFFYQERIDKSTRSNSAKARLIRAAAIAGLVAPVVVVWWL